MPWPHMIERCPSVCPDLTAVPLHSGTTKVANLTKIVKATTRSSGIVCPLDRQGILFREKQKGGFVKGLFWRMCPRSGFWYRGTSACTLVPVFGTENIRMYPRSGFWYPGTSTKISLLCEPPIASNSQRGTRTSKRPVSSDPSEKD